MTVSTAIPCPVGAMTARRARPEGLDRAVMLAGLAITKWARQRADAKALRPRRSALFRLNDLSGLNDSERAELYREATAIREAANAERARWHAIG